MHISKYSDREIQYCNFYVGTEDRNFGLKTQKESQLKSVYWTPDVHFWTQQGCQQNRPFQIVFKIFSGFKRTKKTFSQILGWVRHLRHTPFGPTKPATVGFCRSLVGLPLKTCIFRQNSAFCDTDRPKSSLKFSRALKEPRKQFPKFWGGSDTCITPHHVPLNL